MCDICNNTGWICENCGTQWEKENGETCCGAGENCICNPNGNFEFAAVYASVNPDEVKNWVQ